MKRIFAGCLVAVMVSGLASVYAGSSCCPVPGSKARAVKVTENKDMACAKAVSGIELTKDQKIKVAAITAKCEAAGCAKEDCDASMASIREVLTEEQQAAFDAAVEAEQTDS